MKVLFLSVSAGGGHLRAAEALKECLELKYLDSKSIIIDTMKYINPLVDKLIIGSYLSAVKKTPAIYKKIYELSDSGVNINNISKSVNKFLSFRIKKLIDEFKPSVIVCTHPFPVQMLSNLKKKGQVTVPIVAVVTDYAVHLLWTFDCIDAFVVAHDLLKLEAIDKGFSGDIIYPLGIPVSNNFLRKRDKPTIFKELNLEEKLTVLIMGGSLGFGEVRDVFQALLRSEKDLQIIAITGQNQKLKKQLEKYSINTGKSVKILSYTEKVSDIMDVSDLIITKPGGMTITESLVKELPIVIMSPIPGQEEKNAQFLLANGAAIRITQNDNVESVLSQIIDDPSRVLHMKEKARLLAKPNSCEDIIALLETFVSSK